MIDDLCKIKIRILNINAYTLTFYENTFIII